MKKELESLAMQEKCIREVEKQLEKESEERGILEA